KGTYLSNLQIVKIILGDSEKTKKLNYYLPSVEKIDSILQEKNNVNFNKIDGLFSHPKIGLIVIEINAIKYAEQTSEKNQLVENSKQKPKRSLDLEKIFEESKKQLIKHEAFIKELFKETFEKDISFPVYKIICMPNADIGQISIPENIYLLDKN